MTAVALLTPPRRDALLAVLALALLLAPVWAPLTHLGDPSYRYERTPVTAANGPIEYANESDALTHRVISTDVACTGGTMESRACFFERRLAAGHTVPTSVSASTSGKVGHFPTFERYDYAVLNGTVYETSYVANRSGEDDGDHRVELALEPVPARRALDSVSMRAERAPAPVRRAAERGTATSHRHLDPPKTPIQVGGDTYYRVYQLGQNDASAFEKLLAGLLRWGSPLVGVTLVVSLSGRFEVRYVGE
ncbi:hypothetical protein M0R88_13195 [Halorussus gelatinilyticus]|uniref:Uncharacterized protein n=1 Tax=Halorussus gelatinilyticus TaxID=2937524 RepID=A0A8U0IFK0_9EURY|nr:hypothetical protein [Halorussus gelatinilyticus]UPV99470.1 hypothetical protein M0R88_13195 [Halorussus gelatinilyticus]